MTSDLRLLFYDKPGSRDIYSLEVSCGSNTWVRLLTSFSILEIIKYCKFHNYKLPEICNSKRLSSDQLDAIG